MPTLSPRPTTARVSRGQVWLNALLQAASETVSDGGSAAAPQEASRLEARRALANAGLPDRHQEEWRFTPLSLLPTLAPRLLASSSAGDEAAAAALAPPPPVPPATGSTLRIQLDAPDIHAHVAWPEGIERLEGDALSAVLGAVLTDTGAASDWAVALNTAIVPSVLALRVRGAVAPCLELVSQAGARAGVLPLRVLLLLEDGASLTLLQAHQADGPSLTSVVMEIALGREARLQHGLVARGADAAGLLAVTAVRQAAGSQWSHASLCSGWGLARQEPVVLQREGQADTRLRGLHWLNGSQLADTHSRVRFAGPEGSLDQLHKVVADGDSRSVFNGSVQVPREAQRTNAAQLSRSLLLSDRARIDTKPELEIVADDVRCTHGATISRLRDEQLFYLRSRGIAADQASRLLLRGYCEEVSAELPAAAGAWNPLSFLNAASHRP
ncbi:MAG: SufD family Fe-S cluster assembly protein [Cyanobacteriota bacterium]|nr:SufD family Fe-S cluster assembly protein [Cyanobacteriota bacterium]